MQNYKPRVIKISLSKLQNGDLRFRDSVCYPVEFHISRSAREKYDFDQTIFTASGNVIFHNLHAARIFAQKMNQQRDLINHPENAVSAAEINAMGLIDEILHYVILLYRMEVNQVVLPKAEQWLADKLGAESLDKVLHRFVTEFPPVEVYQDKTDVSSYLKNQTEGVPNRLIALEEMLMLWLANRNEAFDPYEEL